VIFWKKGGVNGGRGRVGEKKEKGSREINRKGHCFLAQRLSSGGNRESKLIAKNKLGRPFVRDEVCRRKKGILSVYT